MPTGSYVRTLEHRERIRQTALARGYGKWMKGRSESKSFNWKGGLPECVDCGKKLSRRESTRCRKCNLSHPDTINRLKNFPRFAGEKAANWRGEITKFNKLQRTTVEARLWREAVFSRDAWTCQACGQIGKILHAHHIKAFAKYPELRFAIDNGQTLCKPCHLKEHSKEMQL